jgi:hypothetical protein
VDCSIYLRLGVKGFAGDFGYDMTPCPAPCFTGSQGKRMHGVWCFVLRNFKMQRPPQNTITLLPIVEQLSDRTSFLAHAAHRNELLGVESLHSKSRDATQVTFAWIPSNLTRSPKFSRVHEAIEWHSTPS